MGKITKKKPDKEKAEELCWISIHHKTAIGKETIHEVDFKQYCEMNHTEVNDAAIILGFVIVVSWASIIEATGILRCCCMVSKTMFLFGPSIRRTTLGSSVQQ